MNLDNALIVQGAVEGEAEVLNDRVKDVSCSCGHTMKVAAGITLSEKITLIASTEKSTSCPSCGQQVNLT